MSDDRLTALVRAIAHEMIELGYVPDSRPGYVQHGDKEPVRIIAPETWEAMKEILASAEH